MDAIGKIATLNHLSRIYAKQERVEEALNKCQQALEINESIGDIFGKADTLHELARIYAKQGIVEEALNLRVEMNLVEQK
jgi:tetratricopeptide (TPR) repeat protein